jgi:hypothetical protein
VAKKILSDASFFRRKKKGGNSYEMSKMQCKNRHDEAEAGHEYGYCFRCSLLYLRVLETGILSESHEHAGTAETGSPTPGLGIN